MSLIDVHAHFVTAEYVAAAQRAGHHLPDGMPDWPSWSAGRHLELMDTAGIDRAILSVSSPGVHFGDDLRARVLARRMNDTAAQLVADHPSRFGFFASLPLPDLDGALAETAHAFDLLGADGVLLWTNAGGRYPGDPRWEPLWRELDARAATVFLHPTSPPNWRDVALDRPRPMLEFLFDGARAVSDLILTGIVQRYPRIRFIITYAGGVLPMLSDRLDRYTTSLDPTAAEQLGEFWYDVAGTAVPHQLPSLQTVAGDNHILYGSEYCFTSPDDITRQLARLDTADAGWRDRPTANARQLAL